MICILKTYICIHLAVLTRNMMIDRWYAGPDPTSLGNWHHQVCSIATDKCLVVSINPPEKNATIYWWSFSFLPENNMSRAWLFQKRFDSQMKASELMIVCASCGISRHPLSTGGASIWSGPSHCSQNLRCSSWGWYSHPGIKDSSEVWMPSQLANLPTSSFRGIRWYRPPQFHMFDVGLLVATGGNCVVNPMP